jgi:hypothetical protein
MDHEDREREFEQALARYLRRDADGARNAADAHLDLRDAGATVACPDAETLAAFHERALSNQEMSATTEHIAECSRCQEILGQLEATDEIPLRVEAKSDLQIRKPVLSTGTTFRAPKDISRGRGFKVLRWAAPAGAIAAGLLIWVVVRDNNVQRISRSDNVQVAQEQPTDERLAAPQPLPASPVPEPVTKTKQFNGKRKEESNIKRAEESEAFRAPKRPSSSVIANSGVAANEIGAVAGDTSRSPQANIRQLPLNGRNYASHQAIENKPPEISSQQADVSVTAAAAPAPAAAGDPRAKSAAPSSEGAKTDAKQSANATSKFETQRNGDIELQSRQQVVVNDQLELSPSLKKDSFENAKIILAPTRTVRWRVGAVGRIERSVDSGVKWVQQISGVKAELLAGSAPSEVMCWIVGRSGTILRTTDGGGHWNKVVSPMGGDVAGVQAVDAMTATIFDANKSARFITHDGGATWEAAKQ